MKDKRAVVINTSTDKGKVAILRLQKKFLQERVKELEEDVSDRQILLEALKRENLKLKEEIEKLRKEKEEIKDVCNEDYSSREKIQDIRKILKSDNN